MLPSQEDLAALFSYDADTGSITNKVTKKTYTAKTSSGRIQVSVAGKAYLAHRVIWMLVHGAEPETIDHINGQADDNRLCNLRAVTNAENQLNQSIHKHNNSGVMGVHPDGDLWRAKIQKDGKQIYLGRYKTFNEAKAARKAAEKILGFHPNHGRKSAA